MLGLIGSLARRASRALRPSPGAGPDVAAFGRALAWLERHSAPGAGVQVSDVQRRPYPEVTGYLIPTLLEWGERERALDCARWLASIQRPDGSWPDPDGRAGYAFDTGQVLRGLVAALPGDPELREPLRRGCEWLAAQVDGSGRIAAPEGSHWVLPDGSSVPEAIHLHVFDPLKRAAAEFGRDAWAGAAARAEAHYLARPDLTAFATLSHFHAYILEALLDLGHFDRVAEGLAEIERLQRPDGAVPARPGARWVCSTGLAQYAALWYRLGRRAPGDRAFARLLRLQRGSGGFRGSRGRGADYFPREEIGWAVKYFLDALHWRIRSSFEAGVAGFPATIVAEDGRFRLIEEQILAARPGVLLDAGCGRGRFVALLKERHPGLRAMGLDLSEAMLRHLPPGVEPRRGSLLRTGLADASVDLAFCVESLEHAVNLPGAIRELARVVRSPGTLVIVDKDAARRGALALEPWEQWFEAREVEGLLRAQGFAVEVRRGVGHDGSDGSDGLFLGWVARR